MSLSPEIRRWYNPLRMEISATDATSTQKKELPFYVRVSFDLFVSLLFLGACFGVFVSYVTYDRNHEIPTDWLSPAMAVSRTAVFCSLAMSCLFVLRWRGRSDSCTMRVLNRISLLPRKFDFHSAVLVGFLVLSLFASNLLFKRISSDGREHFAKMRSLVLDWDVDFSNDQKLFPGRGTAAIYPIGPSLLWAPFYVASHVVAWATHMPEWRKGVDFVHQRAVGFAGFFYGAIALVLVYKILTKFFSRQAALISALCTMYATFVVYYWLYEASMPHSISIFSTSLFLYVWIQSSDEERTISNWALLGASAGLMAMGRYQDAFLVVVLLPGLIQAVVRLLKSGSWPAILTLFKGYLVAGGFGLLAFTPQLLHWKAIYGSYFYIPIAEHREMFWFNPSPAHVLWSYNHGLMTWTPIVFLAFLGLAFLIRRQGALAAALILALLIQLYINSACEDWWGSSAFGARRFSCCFCIFAVGLAELIRVAAKRPMIPILGAGTIFVAFNVGLMYRFWSGELPVGEVIPPSVLIGGTIDKLRIAGLSPTFPASMIFGLRYRVLPGRYEEILDSGTYSCWAVDFGAQGSDQLLGRGWSVAEHGNRGGTWMWSEGRSSTLLVKLRRPLDYDLVMNVQPYTYPGSPSPQRLKIAVNGNDVTDISLSDDMQEYRVGTSSHVWRQGLNELRFDYGYTKSPSELGISSDSRELSVRFDWIRAESVSCRP